MRGSGGRTRWSVKGCTVALVVKGCTVVVVEGCEVAVEGCAMAVQGCTVVAVEGCTVAIAMHWYHLHQVCTCVFALGLHQVCTGL